MTIEKKIRLLTITVIVLIATNIATIATIFFHPYDGNWNVKSKSRETMNQQLRDGNFTSNQMQMMKQVRHGFMNENHAIMDSMRTLHQQLHEELLKDKPDSIHINILLNRIGVTYTNMKGQTVKHFLKMKPFCSPEQQQLLLQFDDPMQRMNMHGTQNNRGRRGQQQN
jgi:hypothetical protein